MTLGALHDLARDCGILVHWHDVGGTGHEVGPEALLGVLRVLGADLDRPDEAPDALAARRRVRFGQVLEPTVVAWDDGPVTTVIRHDPDDADRVAECRVRREDGEPVEWRVRLADLPVVDVDSFGSLERVGRRLAVPGALPMGRHGLDVEIRGRHHSATVLVAPTRGAAGDPLALTGRWGLVAPTYALRNRRGGAPGDFGHLDQLAETGGRYGASVVATLPLLAAFLGDPLEISPYLPVSRRFWNELYVDLEHVPERDADPAVAARLAGPAWRQARLALRDASRVDYARATAVQREVLEALAGAMSRAPAARTAAFDRFVADHPEVARYARFRAAGERLGADWRRWPARMRDGSIDGSDVDPRVAHYHRYVQWLAHEQLGILADRFAQRDQVLALDLPIGTHPWGYDVWCAPGAYGIGAQAGAPPDSFAPGGQGWGFPPVHPEAARADGHQDFRACLAHHFRFAKLLRIDHVMGLHRQWWVPDGASATDGAYVRYPAEELWAAVCLEAARAGAAVVGENLGTVPMEVDEALDRHGARGMAVAQFRADPFHLDDVPARAVAMWGTHDMPTFRGWHADAEPDADPDADADADGLRDRYDAFLTNLADCPADVVMVGLEDLALDPVAHNVPGTVDGQNWRVPAPCCTEDLDADPGRHTSLQILADRRAR